MKNRNISLDIARGLSVIWIVGILHVIGYVVDPTVLPILLLKIIEGITISCLATFTYLSGYFVAGKQLNDRKDIVLFFKKRVLRFGILYFIACISLYIAGIVLSNDVRWFFSIEQLIATLTGLSGLIPDFQPATFWYFSMIILFYVLTPIIGFSKSEEQKQIRIMIIFGCLLFETILFDADVRLPFYFIFYALGALSQSPKVYNIKQIIILLTLFFFLTPTINLEYYLSLQNLLIGILGFLLILSLSYKIKRPKTTSILSFLAYGSMCAYLYHRHIYAFIKKLYHGSYWPIYIWPLVIIAVFVVAYIIQFTYDKCLEKAKQ